MNLPRSAAGTPIWPEYFSSNLASPCAGASAESACLLQLNLYAASYRFIAADASSAVAAEASTDISVSLEGAGSTGAAVSERGRATVSKDKGVPRTTGTPGVGTGASARTKYNEIAVIIPMISGIEKRK
jgi:hypothetical protein